MKFFHSLCFVLAGAVIFAVAGCSHKQQVTQTPVTPPAAQPQPVASLSVVPDSVQRGQSAELRWNTQNASAVTIDGVGTVAASGSRQITPTSSTTYHLVAKGDGGSTEASARLTVSAPPAAVSSLTDEQLFERNMKDVFFNYDNATIRADEQATVNADAQFLAAHPSMKLVLEGHCDERGSEEYNMTLGENRADGVRTALMRMGISPDRIKLISYGKEKPFCTTAENESCWQQNRRAHFALQASR